MNLLVLGAGHIGRQIARWLSATGDYHVSIADQSDEALAPLRVQNLDTLRLDINNGPALEAALRGRDAVVNALPFFASIPVARAAHACGVHYFDLTEDVNATQTIAALAKDANTAFMPQCGLAPGFVGIVAHSLVRGFDRVNQVKMRVGALPQYPNNALKYNLTWSVDGLINEYLHPCDALRDGELTQLAPMEGLEHLQVDGVDYEAFNTSGGLGTLCDTLAGKVGSLDYKTLRYPGHLTLMRFLIQDLGLRDKPETLRTLLQDALPRSLQDKVVVFVAVDGWKQGHHIQDVFTRTLLSCSINEHAREQVQKPAPEQTQENTVSAIQLATTAGVCTAVDLFREGRLPARGFIRQESISLQAFLANRFGRVYNAGDIGDTGDTRDTRVMP
ncbi:MAG: saccharopine dehydrogenase NADP-binding domain-containing protein [Castellaniella sp.]